VKLRFDPTLCDGVGYCADILPERIRRDDWGYPIVDPGPITDPAELVHARRAVATCPRVALILEPHGDRT
jgi:ferredoxin